MQLRPLLHVYMTYVKCNFQASKQPAQNYISHTFRNVQEDFPYTVRLESTITESNGSSSMASVCGGCLALLDAGKLLLTGVAIA